MMRPYYLFILLLIFFSGCQGESATQQQVADLSQLDNWLPTGVVLDPAGPTFDIGPLPLTMRVSPEGDRAVMLLSGWRMQGIQVVDPASQEVVQTLEQECCLCRIDLLSRWHYVVCVWWAIRTSYTDTIGPMDRLHCETAWYLLKRSPIHRALATQPESPSPPTAPISMWQRIWVINWLS